MHIQKSDVLSELNYFSKIKFNSELHTYTIDDYVFEYSVTKWLKLFIEAFNKDFWSKYKAKETGVTQQEILDAWETISKRSTDLIGTPFHNYIQSLFDDNFTFELGTYIVDELSMLIKLADDFKIKSKDNLIPIASEVIVGHKALKVAGTFDQLFFNVKENNLELWDWKTSKKIDIKLHVF